MWAEAYAYISSVKITPFDESRSTNYPMVWPLGCVCSAHARPSLLTRCLVATDLRRANQPPRLGDQGHSVTNWLSRAAPAGSTAADVPAPSVDAGCLDCSRRSCCDGGDGRVRCAGCACSQAKATSPEQGNGCHIAAPTRGASCLRNCPGSRTSVTA